MSTFSALEMGMTRNEMNQIYQMRLNMIINVYMYILYYDIYCEWDLDLLRVLECR